MGESESRKTAKARTDSGDRDQEAKPLQRGTLVVILHAVDLPGYGGYRRGDMARLEDSVAQTLIGNGAAQKYREGLRMPKPQAAVVRVGFGPLDVKSEVD